MLTELDIIKKLEANKAKVRAFGVKKISLIGSYAQGQAHSKSDIDFLVSFQKGRGLFDDYVHLHQFLRDVFGKDIDLGEESLIREELREHILGGERIEAKL